MTKVATDQLPDNLTELLNGEALESKEGETFILLTLSDDGWPHVALLSVGEVFAASPREIRLALWPGTTTTGNLRRNGRATLLTVRQATAYSIELEAPALAGSSAAEGSLARFSARVRRVLADTVDYAHLTTGIRFVLKDRVHVRSWEQTLQTLRTP